jgi:hypothetical protein
MSQCLDVVESQYPLYFLGFLLTFRWPYCDGDDPQCCLQPQDVSKALTSILLVLGAPGPVFLHGQLCYEEEPHQGQMKNVVVEVSVMDSTVTRTF